MQSSPQGWAKPFSVASAGILLKLSCFGSSVVVLAADSDIVAAGEPTRRRETTMMAVR